MKRKFTVISALVLSALALTSCGGSTKSLVEHGMDVVSLMDEIVNSEEYLGSFTNSADFTEITTPLAEADYSDYDTVYEIGIDPDTIHAMYGLSDSPSVSAELLDYYNTNILSTVATQIVGQYGGVTQLSVSSVTSARKVFVYDALEEGTIFLYTFDDTAPIAVTFTPGEDGAVSAQGCFILADGFTASSAPEIEEMFAAYSPTVTVVAGS